MGKEHRAQTQVRRMMSEREKKNVRKKKIKKNPTIPEIVKDDDDGRVLGTSKQFMDDKVHKLMAEDMYNLPPPYQSDDRGISFSTKSLTVPSGRPQQRKSEIRSLLDHTTTLADDHKPSWMKAHPPGTRSHENAAYIVDPDDQEMTATEETLPWKREGVEIISPVAMKQRVTPWIDNKDSINHNSPSTSLLGQASERRTNILGLNLSKRDSLIDEPSGSRRASRHLQDKDFLKVLNNPLNIRRVSAPPTTRQTTPQKPNMEVGGNMSPVVERRTKFLSPGILLNIENETDKM